MATNLEKYPIIQLLDNLNNPVSPAVQIDSIYEDPGTKNALDLIYKYDASVLDSSLNLVLQPGDEGRKIIKIIDTSTSVNDGSAPEEPTTTPKDLYLVTDAWVGDGPNKDSLYTVDNTLHVRKFNASDLLTWWFENDYLSKKAGDPIFFGTCIGTPTSVTKETDSSDNVEKFHPTLPAGNYAYGDVMIEDTLVTNNKKQMYKVTDFNSTNFFGLYSRRGIIKPSGAKIWFVIDTGSTNKIVSNVKLYGFSGEDSPQEIEIQQIGSVPGAYVSVGEFGIDTGFNQNNTNPLLFNDGLEYHIFVKYTETKV